MASVTTQLIVEGMSCSHCVNSVKKAVSVIQGVHHVDVNLNNKTVTVEHDDVTASLQAIKEAIEDQGYDVK